MSNNPFAVADTATKQLASSVRQPGPPASALHEASITAAYFIVNTRNSANTDLVLEFELGSGYNHKIQSTVLASGKTTAMNSKTKKEELLWSYVPMAHMVGAACEGKTIGDVFPSVQEKIVKVFDFNTRKDVDTKVQMVTDLVGKKLLLGLQRKISNKNALTGKTDANGRPEWAKLAERKTTLEFGVAGNISDRRTAVEFNGGIAAENAAELDKWEQLNTGKDYDAYKPVAGASGVPAGVAASAETLHNFGAPS